MVRFWRKIPNFPGFLHILANLHLQDSTIYRFTHFLSFLHDPVDENPSEGGLEVGVDVGDLLPGQGSVPGWRNFRNERIDKNESKKQNEMKANLK